MMKCKACGKELELFDIPQVPVCSDCVMAALNWGIDRWMEATK